MDQVFAKRGSRRGERTASKALFGAAVIHLLPGLLYWPVAGLKFELNDYVRLGGFLILTAMGVVARRAPLPSAAVSCSLYLAFLGVQASQGIIEILGAAIAVFVGGR